MKTIAELTAIRDRMQSKIALRHGNDATRVVVSMGTCGIAAGARDVLNAIVDEVYALDLIGNVIVVQSGCKGDCANEPAFEVIEGDKKTTYVKMNAEAAKRVVREHLKDGKPVNEFIKDNKG